MRHAERLTEPLAHHGEGPFWDAHGERLLYLDVLKGDVLSVLSSGSVVRHSTPARVASVIRRRNSGGFVIGTEHGVVAANDDFDDFRPIAEFITDPRCRTNDGGCDPLGGLVIGSMAYDGEPARGVVYRLAADHHVSKLLSPVTISNGVQWSADGRRVFYIDSPTRRVDAFDVDCETGLWSGRQVHIELDGVGVPDGMAIDEDDGLWVAIWGDGAVNHYDAVGDLVERIGVPGVSQTSSCAFGGSDRRTLYITTSREGLSDGGEPDAGAVFAIDTQSRGAVVLQFDG